MKPALLVIDVQKRFYNADEARKIFDEAVEYINVAIDFFREKSLPIICIQHVNEKAGFTPDQPDFGSPENLKIKPADKHFHKTYRNAFTKTGLGGYLKELGVDTLILCGYAAEYCVLSTYCGALDLDLVPIILRGSLASSSRDNIQWVERISDVISYRALVKLLEEK